MRGISSNISVDMNSPQAPGVARPKPKSPSIQHFKQPCQARADAQEHTRKHVQEGTSTRERACKKKHKPTHAQARTNKHAQARTRLHARTQVHKHTHTHKYTSTHTHARRSTQAQANRHKHACTSTYAQARMRKQAQSRRHRYARTSMHLHVCTSTHVIVLTYKHAYTRIIKVKIRSFPGTKIADLLLFSAVRQTIRPIKNPMKLLIDCWN